MAPPTTGERHYTNPRTEFEAAKKALVNSLADKRRIDQELVELERTIYTYEGSYLTDTQNSGGNIMQGFDNFLKPSHATKKRAQEVTDADRLFSNSSATYRKSLAEEKGKDSEGAGTNGNGNGNGEEEDAVEEAAGRAGGGAGRGKKGGYKQRKRKASEPAEETPPPLNKRRRTRTGE